MALIHVAGRGHDEGTAAHGLDRRFEVRVALGRRLGDDDDLRAMVGSPLDASADLGHEGLFAFLRRRTLLEASVHADGKNRRLGGDADEARVL